MKLVIILIFSLSCLLAKGQNAELDSLNPLLLKAKGDTNHALLLARISRLYSQNNKSESGLRLAEKGLQLSRKLRFTKGEILNLLSLNHCFRQLGDYVQSADFAQQALIIAEEWNDPALLVSCLNAYAFIHYIQGDIRSELKVYQKAKSYAIQTGDSALMALILSNIGKTYLLLGDKDSAGIYLKKSLRLVGSRKNLNTAYILRQLGNLENLNNHLEKAHSYLRESIPISTSLNENYGATEAMCMISRLYLKSGERDSAYHYAWLALKLIREVPDTSWVSLPAELLSEIYEKDKNYEMALAYRKLSIDAEKVRLNEENKNKIYNLTVQDQEKRREIEKAKTEYFNQIKIYLLSGGLIVLLLLALILFHNNRNKQKANKLLNHQKEVIESSLHQLHATQAQLVHQEKMASLGELTAGIAHEIQNPLNFVNNFSEVSIELLDELKIELEKGNKQDAMALADNISENLAKIHHHGSLADSIVKNMLQHSRKAGSVMEVTDINTLTDEFLRLSYHGFRAKNQGFSAILETHFDKSINTIPVIPQELGRVLVNLFNNSFYSILQKKKNSKVDFEPLIQVTTSQTSKGTIIRIRDNGNGISEKIIQKIYQPFFTTKPTGEGTGLGLSLSFDIITKGHGGEIKLNSVEGEFAEFIIQLPATLKPAQV